MNHTEIVLEYLKQRYLETHIAPMLIFTDFAWKHFEATQPIEVQQAYERFSDLEEFQVMQEFTEWALEGLEDVEIW